MSVKTVNKIKTVEVPTETIFCDICNSEVEEGQAIIRLKPARVKQNGYGIEGGRLDICSVECLTKNINGIAVLLNTKSIPSISEYEEKGRMSKIECNVFDYDSHKAYSKCDNNDLSSSFSGC